MKHQEQASSGVGAKHQNGCAEWSIQKILSMACTFMIHVSLHWDEQGSDAVALWPFSVCHAVWLYNRLPNGVTGLSPMEILTGTHLDHQSLLRTHVWGCSVYVLDPKLQDGKKITKLNCLARQGQLLGFSDEHSSLAATVCHLTTGFVSPQFHMVFDVQFHTVYGDGEGNLITDAICDLLWENDWELYDEDEYGPDGSLIYTPPPLDEVWLDEEGLHKHCERLLDQHRWVKHQTRIKKQVVPIPQIDDAPGPAPHHPTISEDISISNDDDNPNDASLFDSPILFEPKGNVWVDHGGPNNGPVLENSAASAPPASSISKKNVSWDDVVVDKPYSQEGENTPCLHCNPKPSWKKHEQQALTHLYVVPSYSQVPPMACCLSRKRRKY